MCTGAACNLCGAGCWNSSAPHCDHDSLDRHEDSPLESREQSHDLAAPRSGTGGDPDRVVQADDRPEVGSWWWVTSSSGSLDESSCDRPGGQWLGCVVEVGSNYAKVRGVRCSQRVGMDDFHAVCTPESRPREFIDSRVGDHRDQVRSLMGEIRDLCHRLGVPLRQALAAQESSSTALAVVHGVNDVREYRESLVTARERTLPELFAQVREQHEQMATWMRAELIPAEAELRAAEQVTEVISGKIHTVELYAGLQEELVCVREGDPADLGTRVHLMQRMHYMDEECLARYEAGGMDFQDVASFDAWLARDGNFGRILPHERCVVAFRVRRNRKDYPELEPFISFRYNIKNKATYLSVRNGRQLWRMSTTVEFGESLFPRREDCDLLGDQELWVRSDGHDLDDRRGIITRRERDAAIDRHRARRAHLAQKLWQWHRAGKPDGEWSCVAVSEELDPKYVGCTHVQVGDRYRTRGMPDDWSASSRCEAEGYSLLTPDNLYHDDAMRRVRAATLEHNRVAVIVQGLLDRSTCLHPHPPWRIWTPEGFAAGVELVYDVSRAIAPGEAPDFEEYRRQLNRGLRPGCHTIGQRDAWLVHMEDLYGDKARWRCEGRHGRGPGEIHRVHQVRRDGSYEFRWTRDRARPKWVDHPTRPGYLKAEFPEIEVRWSCAADRLTCVDAYTPGDFHLFFDDPRTRADYLEWAPILLACEDWHRARREVG